MAPGSTDAERFIDLTEPADVVRRKAVVLNVGKPQARVRVAGAEAAVDAVHEAPSAPSGAPGAVLAKHPDGWTVQAADRALRITSSGDPA